VRLRVDHVLPVLHFTTASARRTFARRERRFRPLDRFADVVSTREFERHLHPAHRRTRIGAIALVRLVAVQRPSGLLPESDAVRSRHLPLFAVVDVGSLSSVHLPETRTLGWAVFRNDPRAFALDAVAGASDNSPMTMRSWRLPIEFDPLIAEAKQRMRRRRLAVFALGLGAIAVAVAAFAVGRGGGRPPVSPPRSAGGATHGRPGTVGGERVREVFARHGLRPSIVFNTRTASKAEIDRIAPLRGDSAARLAASLARQGLDEALARGAAHPMTLLVYPSVGTSIHVWGKLSDAKSDGTKQKQALAKAQAQLAAARKAGHQVTGSPPRVTRVANMVLTTARFTNGEPGRLKAALAELTKRTS
jgi:hypothetical protein